MKICELSIGLYYHAAKMLALCEAFSTCAASICSTVNILHANIGKCVDAD